jgi:predicted O-methyltransferase YrrM
MSAASLPVTARQVRPVRHLTPRYLLARARQMRYEREHPDDPWLTPAAIRLLESLLRPADRGAEFGSGRSTLWFASRVRELTSVEHDSQWHAAVTTRLRDRGLRNVDYILAPEDQPMEQGGSSAYAKTALAFPDASLDFSLVDGHYRDYSAKFILPKVKPGGLLIIDNVNWYLPCESRAPNSRTPALGPKTQAWADVAQELASWRSIWTSSGVWDTAIFIKPADAPTTGTGHTATAKAAETSMERECL